MVEIEGKDIFLRLEMHLILFMIRFIMNRRFRLFRLFHLFRKGVIRMEKKLMDTLFQMIEDDPQFKVIETTKDLTSDRLRLRASISRAVNRLKEMEKALDIELTDEDIQLIHKYALPENALETVPEHLTVAEVAELIEVSPQMVRRKCMTGEILAHRTLNGKGKWRIPAKQFMTHPRFEELVMKYQIVRTSSDELASNMVKFAEENESSLQDA